MRTQTGEQALVARQKWPAMGVHLYHYYCSKKFRWSFLALACILSAACSLENEVELTPAQIEAAQVEEMVQKFKEVQGAPFDDFLQTLTRRLSANLPPGRRIPFSFKLLKSSKAFAVASPTAMVAFSSGLVLRLDNEAELAFVLSHEISHGMLGHFRINTASLSDEERRKFELEADKNALGLMALAGYDPRTATMAVKRICEAQGNDGQAENYPSMQERMLQIESVIRASGWRPPGIVDRRDFRVFKSALAELT